MPTTSNHIYQQILHLEHDWFDKCLNSYQHLGAAQPVRQVSLGCHCHQDDKRGFPKLPKTSLAGIRGQLVSEVQGKKIQGYHSPNPEFFGKYGNSKPYGKDAS